MATYRKLKLVKDDPWLEPVEQEVWARNQRYTNRLKSIEDEYGSITRFASAHEYFGIHFDKDADAWIYREWAPRARDLYFFGDFNRWQRHANRMNRMDNGVWEIILPREQFPELKHESLVKVLVHGENGWHERIPVYIKRVIQNVETRDFAGQIWAPPAPFDWGGRDRFNLNDLGELYIYEAHVGMSGETPEVSTNTFFASEILPRIKAAGYNAIQLMAVAEHPYYGSFGYHVSNYFAPTSKFGTPEDLKHLVKMAHNMGIAVIMDVVHSHTVKNYNEGINDFDGSDGLYTHPGARGDHPHWGSRVFDYGKTEVIRFLLSNLRYWLQEFHFDGFRFDGVTSMLYHHHGFVDSSFWNQNTFFTEGVEWDAQTYLQLANKLIHRIRPDAISIAEDVSGMPGIGAPLKDGGLGFDYRLGMGLPDYWIHQMERVKDEDWNMGNMFHALTNRKWDTGTVAYCESHDQAMVGDKTIAFRLMDQEMYWKMGEHDQSTIIDRGIALHKMIRLATLSLGGNAWLNFMGNEFGHPEWLDFPREGNGWSYWYARRQWSLVDKPGLKYRNLLAFDRAMVELSKTHKLLSAGFPALLNVDETNKTLVFERGGLIFVFNWHPTASIPDYEFAVNQPGVYKLLLSSDESRFGGWNRQDNSLSYYALQAADGNTYLKMYNTHRSVAVFGIEQEG